MNCGECGEEIRFGVRHGRSGWLHREDVEHPAVIGQPFTREMQEEIERQLDLPRTRLAPGVLSKCPTYQVLWPLETYTTREHDRAKMAKKKRDALDAEDEIVHEIPPPILRATPADPSEFPPRSGIRQVINLIEKTEGWELRRLTKAQGPYVGASGEVLSISDSVVIGASGVDGNRRHVVGSWRDGKFDFAIAIDPSGTRKVNATEMKDWIKAT